MGAGDAAQAATVSLAVKVARRVLPVLAVAAGVGLVVYAGDYASLRWQIPKRAQFGSVSVRRFYAVALKNRNTEYMFDEPQDMPCVNSLFPHFGDPPCWYLTRHKQQRIDVNAGPPKPIIDTF
jgi:hypothetical protein